MGILNQLLNAAGVKHRAAEIILSKALGQRDYAGLAIFAETK